MLLLYPSSSQRVSGGLGRYRPACSQLNLFSGCNTELHIVLPMVVTQHQKPGAKCKLSPQVEQIKSEEKNWFTDTAPVSSARLRDVGAVGTHTCVSSISLTPPIRHCLSLLTSLCFDCDWPRSSQVTCSGILVCYLLTFLKVNQLGIRSSLSPEEVKQRSLSIHRPPWGESS